MTERAGSATMESDVYEMATVVYKVRSHQFVPSCPRGKSHISFLGLDRDISALRELQYQRDTGRDGEYPCTGLHV